MDHTTGTRILAQLQDPGTTDAWRRTLGAVAPGFDDWVVEAVFGGTYQRPALSLRDRQLVTLGALAALGGVDPQLDGHIRTAFRLGISREQVAETFVHLVPYVGLPRTLAALRRVAELTDGAAS